MTQLESIFKEATKIKDQLIEVRRHIHSYPELSFEENETALYISQKLKDLGLKPKMNVGKTGVVAEISSNNPGKTVAIRADMDALPITESNEISYSSKNKGVMHACGHDVHTAMGLGAAAIISQNPPEKGTVRFVFQPAEEDTNSDGISGAGLMLNDGAFEDVSGVFAAHVFPDMNAGEIAVKSGPLLAACDKFDVKIIGRGTHGAYPELGLDPIVIATHVIQAIQTIVSRKNSALEPLVITVGGIKSNTYRPNIISDFVELTGTARYFYDSTKEMVRKEIENACRIANTMGGSYEINYIYENPPVNNEEKMTALVKSVASDIIGKENVHEATLQMGADDFSFLSKAMPACYFFLGAQIQGDPRSLHTETFDVDENCIPVGASILAGSALKFLND